MNTADFGAKLWSLCHVLRDDGIVYHKYLSELSYLLFLKMADESDSEADLPPGCRWRDLRANSGPGMVSFYRKMLTRLGEDAANDRIRRIFAFPTTVFSHDENLAKVFRSMDGLDWHSIGADRFGDLYEYLLERASTEARAGAGQYFTPRALVDCLVDIMRPVAGEIIQDPAAGTGGFLVATQRYLLRSDPVVSSKTTFEGVEIERDTYRLCLMNFFLHGMTGVLINGDALTRDADGLQPADLILANPPFGSSGGGARARRTDLKVVTSNKQLLFVQHIYRSLKPGGRAAVVVPDNVLFETGAGRRVRKELFDTCDVHTILRLPVGIFYATGVSTVVLIFTKSQPDRLTGNDRLWVYDLRSNYPKLGRGNQFDASSLANFKSFYGQDPLGKSFRPEQGKDFHSWTRQDIIDRDYDLNLVRSSEHNVEDVADPEELAIAIADRLREALSEIEGLASDLADLRKPATAGST
ncbi:N-6 DNA methylase [Mesorhizobium sp. GbtcB19]|uniref:class I SAM-dependent DNA methyltransferase n=1 Tax=Mesorhizobium sp. GbtcB19 TaxID=2824764 RepID=UPI001C307DFC|nr:N-6 DNA methylase [Mesorhizobium sp. GbtcB19]